MKIIAVDYGEKWTGLAYSPDGVVALPLAVVITSDLKNQLEGIIGPKGIDQLVVGIPLMDNGQKTPITDTIKNFFENNNFKIPVEFINERGSTKTALQNSSGGRADDVAAQQILTYWLDQQDAG